MRVRVKFVFERIRSKAQPHIVSTLQVIKSWQSQAYLASIVDTSKMTSTLVDIKIV